MRSRRGELGDVLDVDSSFTFTIGAEASDNYRWSPDQGGGALLDVGIYCLGPIVELWGADPDTSMRPRSGTPPASTPAPRRRCRGSTGARPASAARSSTPRSSASRWSATRRR